MEVNELNVLSLSLSRICSAVCCVLCAVPVEVLHQGLPLVRLHRAVQAEVLPSVGLRYTLGDSGRERGRGEERKDIRGEVSVTRREGEERRDKVKIGKGDCLLMTLPQWHPE
jgi:hypothetical protein